MKMNYCLAGLLAITTTTCLGTEEWVRFSADGKRIEVEAEGISSFRGVSSAVIKTDGKHHRIQIQSHPAVEPLRQRIAVTPYGEAVESTRTYGDGTFQYTLRLKRMKNLQGFTLQGVFHNLSDQNVNLVAFDLLDTFKGPGGELVVPDPAKWLVTPLMEASPALPLNEMEKGLQEAAMVYHENGQGFLVGPVGPTKKPCPFSW